MHIPDGFLAPTITLPAYAAAAPLWVWAARRHFGPNQVESLPAVGALTAVAFVLQTIMIPVPGGTSTHLVGASLLALVRGPWVAFVCESMVLLIQSLFFGAGGITVLGVNALALGLLGPLVAWVVMRLLGARFPRLAPFLAGYLGLQVSTLAVAAVLGLQHALSPTQLPTPFSVVATTMVVPSLLVTGFVEGLYTLFAFRIVDRLRGKTSP
jgi:cobalt/nickel transport system permease protein